VLLPQTAVPRTQDSPLTNAGSGSNLNIAGRVECDASVMAGDGAFGAVGAAPGVRHPGAAAALVAEESRLPLPLGLVRPM
jgi:taspase (threonine aspartase 1)